MREGNKTGFSLFYPLMEISSVEKDENQYKIICKKERVDVFPNYTQGFHPISRKPMAVLANIKLMSTSQEAIQHLQSRLSPDKFREVISCF